MSSVDKTMPSKLDRITIIDFGSQYTQLIARKVREQKVYCTIISCRAPFSKIMEGSPKGFIFSGGPSSVFDRGAPMIEKKIYELGIPILGICYGMKLSAKLLGGTLHRSKDREYGKATLRVNPKYQIQNSKLLQGIPRESRVWMSHGDSVLKPPRGFAPLASTLTCWIYKNEGCSG